MNFQELRTLVDYHYWARDRMLEAIGRLTPEQLSHTIENSFPSVHATLLHLYWAEGIWYARWMSAPLPPPPTAADFPELESLLHAWEESEAKIRGFIEQLGEEGVVRVIEYRAPDGKIYAHPFWQMMQHLVNHGSYHRGQVTMMLRQLGVTPAKPQDLSAFYRENTASV